MADEKIHAAPPVKGYNPIPDWKLQKANGLKEIEERALRTIDQLALDKDLDQRSIALGRTKLQEAFMWLNRGVFQPSRINGLPGDEHACFHGVSLGQACAACAEVEYQERHRND